MGLRFLFKASRGLVFLLSALGVGSVLWFIPWVFVLPAGALVYFPYDEKGERFVRAAGPLVGWFDDEWVPSDEIPPFCKASLVASEDTLFFQHPGILVEEMFNTFQRLQQGKRVKSGGSTITQQLVKNAFLSRDRSVVRKVREAVGALLLDVIVTKDFQLTWYLNIVEFGPKVYGLESAAKHYFKKAAAKLTPSECASLVSVLPSPKKWGKSLSSRKFTGFMRGRYGTVVYRTSIMGIASAKDSQKAKQADPFGGGVQLPGYAARKAMDEIVAKERAASATESDSLNDMLPDSEDVAGGNNDDLPGQAVEESKDSVIGSGESELAKKDEGGDARADAADVPSSVAPQHESGVESGGVDSPEKDSAESLPNPSQ